MISIILATDIWHHLSLGFCSCFSNFLGLLGQKLEAERFAVWGWDPAGMSEDAFFQDPARWVSMGSGVGLLGQWHVFRLFMIVWHFPWGRKPFEFFDSDSVTRSLLQQQTMRFKASPSHCITEGYKESRSTRSTRSYHSYHSYHGPSIALSDGWPSMRSLAFRSKSSLNFRSCQRHPTCREAPHGFWCAKDTNVKMFKGGLGCQYRSPVVGLNLRFEKENWFLPPRVLVFFLPWTSSDSLSWCLYISEQPLMTTLTLGTAACCSLCRDREERIELPHL